MKQELIERIEKARKELRLASGERLTPEELGQERRRKALEELEDFCYRLGMDAGMAIFPRPVWSKGMAACGITIDDRTFYLRPVGENFRVLQSAADGEETLLMTIKAGDPHFLNRLLVNLGEALHVGG
jgi:hypothetical protein